MVTSHIDSLCFRPHRMAAEQISRDLTLMQLSTGFAALTIIVPVRESGPGDWKRGGPLLIMSLGWRAALRLPVNSKRSSEGADIVR
jgi:hypothetical protein